MLADASKHALTEGTKHRTHQTANKYRGKRGQLREKSYKPFTVGIGMLCTPTTKNATVFLVSGNCLQILPRPYVFFM